MAQTDNMNQQVVFLSDGAKRTRGRDAQRINILIAKAVANAIKSTLGPKGMDKMIVDDLGDVTVSNDGATILGEMSIDHPVGKMLVEVAKTQDNEVGDGTTTVVVLAGNLLHKAEKMLDDDIHSSIIINGYRMAAKKSKEFYNELADSVSIKDEGILKDIAVTSMTGKAAEASTELADLVVEAVSVVSEDDNGKTSVDRDKIKVEKKGGAGLTDSELIKGVVIDKEIVNEGMPRKMKNAKIALIDSALEIKETETDAKIQITSPDQLQSFIDQEEKMLNDMVEKIKASEANVVFCQKGIDDLAQHFLAKHGILAVRRVKKSDMGLLAKSTGAKIITRISDLSSSDLGNAENVNSRKVSNEDMIFVEGCKNPKAVTVLVRGGSDHIMDEAERALNDAFGAVISAIKVGKVVAGGGSSEIEVAVKLREYAKSIGGREQLAIDAFAETLEIIPRTLAETAGMDPIDTLVSLRSKHSSASGKYIGVDVYKSELTDLNAEKVIEPLSVKTQAITSASEVTEMILRIDDIIAGSSKGGAPPMPPEAMGGMGGMPMM